MSGIYHELGLKPLINAAGTLTRLSGTLLAPEVTQAMTEAARSFVRIDQLQAAASARIAHWTGAEAGLVTSGAAAGLTLSAAACLCRYDLARMDRLPDTRGMPNEIIIARSHRNAYDHALRAAGAQLVEVGLAERTRDPQPWEIEAAISGATVAVAFSVGFSPLDLAAVVEVAHRHALPVIVDASAALPPKANLKNFIAAGADLVAFSGGKAIRGPQASGILCGRKELIASAALQLWDLDFVPELWDPPPALIDAALVGRGVPNHGLGRAMKVGKEEIVGLLAALARFVAQDEAAENARLGQLATQVADGLAGLAGATVSLEKRRDRWPIVRIAIEPTAARVAALELARQLERGEPPVYIASAEARQNIVCVDPFCLEPGEAAVVAERIRGLLAS